jgi:hypothetical protein
MLNVTYIKHIHIINAKEAFVVMKTGLEFVVSRRRIAFVAEQIKRSRARMLLMAFESC